MPLHAVQFVEEAPGQPQLLGPLWGDRAVGPAGTFLKTPAGWEAPLHAHTADYKAIVIQGTWTHWVPATDEGKGIELPVGSYWTQGAGQPHKDACLSTEACIVLLINDAPYRTYLAK